MRRIAAALTTMSLLSGCASGLPGLRPVSYQTPGETRVFVSYKACPHKAGPNFAPVLTAVALEAASQLIKGFGTALSKGAEGGALPASVSTSNIEVSKDLPQCLIIIRGRFSTDVDHKNETALPPVGVGINSISVMKDGQLFETVLPQVYDLQHYIELQLLPSRNKSALTFGPALIYIARSMDGAKTGDRSLSIAVKFDRPGHDGLGSAVLIGNRSIGKQDAYPLDERNRLLYEAPWFAAPDVPDGDAAANSATSGSTGAVTQAAGTPPSQPVGTPPAQPAGATGISQPTSGSGSGSVQQTKAPGSTNGPFPYTLTTTVIETRPTKQFLAFVASVFTAVEPTLTDAVKGQIDPTTQTAAKKTSIDNESAYATALASAKTALLTYCALPADTSKADLIAKSTAALTAQLAVNKAALDADKTAPFPTLIDAGIADPSSATICLSYK